MRSAFRITDNPLSTQGCSCGSSFAPKEFGSSGDNEDSGKQDDQKKKDSKGDGKSNGPAGTIFAASLATMIKDFFTYRPNLDEDPTKNKVKQAMLYRNRRNFDKALEILEDLLKEVTEIGEEWPITRVQYELAYTYYLSDNLDKADEKFRLVIAR
jgi:TolA-binding protein